MDLLDWLTDFRAIFTYVFWFIIKDIQKDTGEQPMKRAAYREKKTEHPHHALVRSPAAISMILR